MCNVRRRRGQGHGWGVGDVLVEEEAEAEAMEGERLACGPQDALAVWERETRMDSVLGTMRGGVWGGDTRRGRPFGYDRWAMVSLIEVLLEDQCRAMLEVHLAVVVEQ